MRTAAVVCAAFGIDTDLTLVYQLFALLLCLIVASRLSLSLKKPAVTAKRHLPRYATAGEPFEYYIDVVNRGNETERDLGLMDNPLVKSPTFAEFSGAREPDEETRNAYDRFIGYHRYIWLQRRKTGLTIKQQAVPDINRKSKVSVKMEALPLRRGLVSFNSITVLHPDPMGLNYGLTNFEIPEQLMVLPKRYPVPAGFEVPRGRHFQPGGVNATWSIGESDEFASLREYRDGDSLRKIHWASSAKRSKPVVKEFQDEYFVRQALIVDTAPTDNAATVPAILDEAVSVAASFALKMRDSESLLDLIYLGHHLEIITCGSGRDSINRQLEALACMSQSSLDLDVLASAVVSRAAALSGCILVLTAWDAEREDLVERIRHAGTGLEVFLITETITAHVPGYVRQLAVGHVGEGLAAL